MKKEEITRYVPEEKVLLTDIRRLIEETRSGIAVTVNAGLTILYWRIGKRIKEEVLKNKRAEYGKEIVATLSQQLTGDYGKGYTRSNLVRMVQFAEYFQEQKIIVTLSRQLSWTNFLALIPLKKPLQREFYTQIAVIFIMECIDRVNACIITDDALQTLQKNDHWTELLLMELMQKKLHAAIQQARMRLDNRIPEDTQETGGAK